MARTDNPVEARNARLRRCRLESGISQAALARAAGMLQSHVSEAETGQRVIGHRAAWQLARALGIDPADLMPPDDGR